jgi:hypothetical protein
VSYLFGRIPLHREFQKDQRGSHKENTNATPIYVPPLPLPQTAETTGESAAVVPALEVETEEVVI